jgi:DNA-binding transcriptional LysR family regulator
MQGSAGWNANLDWNDVRMFLALCRARTVGSAAAKLGIDASTVSRRLVALEEAMDASLFDRGRDGVSPTKAAEDLLPVAEEIEQAMLRFTNAAESLERQVSGLVRITCPADVAEVVVVPILRELFTRHPALSLELSPGEALLDLTRREADIALRTVRPTRGDLLVTKLASLRWVAAASPELARELRTLHTWFDAPWITWGERLGQIPPARWLDGHAKGVKPILRSDSLRVQLSAVSAGVGVALMPEPSLEHYGLVPLKLGASLRESAAAWPADELYLVTHRALRDVPRVRVVWDLLLQKIGERFSGKKPRGRN